MARAPLVLGIVAHLVVSVAAASAQPEPTSEALSTVRGVVLADSTSATPLQGARISLETSSGFLDAALADEQGRFMVRGRTPTEFVLAVSKPGFAGRRIRLTAASSADPLTVRLAPGAVVIAAIVDGRGDPAVGVGRFIFSGLPPEEYLLVAVNAAQVNPLSDEWQNVDLLARLASSAQRVTLAEGERAEVQVRIELRELSGR